MHVPNAEFVSLADVVRANPPAVAAPPSPPLLSAPPPTADGGPLQTEVPAAPLDPAGFDGKIIPDDGEDDRDGQTAGRAARLFHSALADAFDGILADLVRDFARDVLARELRLGGVDLATIARRLITERAGDGPLRLRVAYADSGVACDVPLVIDATLEPGDAILECRSGTIDARLRIRLATLLAARSR